MSLEELAWIVVNLIGLIIAVAATFESQLDFEAVRLLGGNGARIMKAKGNRRDEAIKALVHALLMVTGIIVSASPTPRQSYEAFAALWGALAIIVVSGCLAAGSLFTLLDRRRLWRMFETEADKAKPDEAVAEDAKSTETE